MFAPDWLRFDDTGVQDSVLCCYVIILFVDYYHFIEVIIDLLVFLIFLIELLNCCFEQILVAPFLDSINVSHLILLAVSIIVEPGSVQTVASAAHPLTILADLLSRKHLAQHN